MKELNDLLHVMQYSVAADRVTAESARAHEYFDKQLGLFGSNVPLQP